MKRLDIIFHFDIVNDMDTTNFTYEELANYALDCIWDDVYNCGLRPGDYEIKTFKEDE
jgi:hypothetical protein